VSTPRQELYSLFGGAYYPGGHVYLGITHQDDGNHYAVGQPLLGNSLPFLLVSVKDQSWSEVLRLCILSTYYHKEWTGQKKPGLGLPPLYLMDRCKEP